MTTVLDTAESMLKVPIVTATTWANWLEPALMDAAAEMGAICDGGEEINGFEVFFFEGLRPDELTKLSQEIFTKQLGENAPKVALGGEREVVVMATKLDTQWLQPLGANTSRYDRTMKELCHDLSEDVIWQQWWAKTGYSALEFHQDERFTHPWIFHRHNNALLVEARVNLSVLRGRQPIARSDEAAVHNLHLILDNTAAHLQIPHPEFIV